VTGVFQGYRLILNRLVKLRSPPRMRGTSLCCKNWVTASAGTNGAYTRSSHALAALACASIVAWAASAPAQTFPDRPIKIIAPFTPGSPNDVVARLIAPAMGAQLGQSVVIDNRPGGGTSIGVKSAMSAEPDGYTLLVSNSPTHFIAPFISKTFSYDPLKDFATVASIASGGLMLVIATDVPAKTLQEFVVYAKANPGKLNFGFGQGTLPQLVGEMFKLATNTEIANIPYKGGAQAIPDMLGGRVQMNIGTISTLAPLVREGKLRALAITSAARNPELPDVPTMAESGLP